MDAMLLLARLEPKEYLAPAIACGLFGLASRFALELVDPPADPANLCRLVARSKPVLDAFGTVVAQITLSLRRNCATASNTFLLTAAREHHYSQDATALAEMLARLVLDFEHVPLAHAHLVLLSEQVLPFLT